MSVLIFLEIADNEIKKSSIEAIQYGLSLANQTGTTCAGLVLGSAAVAEQAGQAGLGKVYQVNNSALNLPDANVFADAVASALQKTGAKTLVLAKSGLTDAFVATVGAKTQAAVATNVVGLPQSTSPFILKRSIFTGKAFANVELKADSKILSIRKNAISTSSSPTTCSVEVLEISITATPLQVKSTQKATGEILLPDADIVVSGGRGLKGPENWNLVTDMAKVLGAATGCSKPVSDLHWRPHHEHVGQTGIKVSPSLYIALGISGAIQHVAGINSSKVIVAVNKDPEAPIFKIADYGIVGDAFEIAPKMTAEFQKVK